MRIREFRDEDAEFCFETRVAAFRDLFSDELDADEIEIATKTYSVGDYIRMAKEAQLFIVEDGLDSEGSKDEIASLRGAPLRVSTLRVSTLRSQRRPGIESGNAGFFSIKRVDESTAEVPLVYLHQDHIKKGLGSQSLKYIERWVLEN